ncbi:hypothetical protein KIPE111705_01600 [Kibdelosporangium persicum]|uniref:FAD-dependent pyridine nucleotide-disulfide oxidoreductase n=1 Tax=Kibdelosporangium persicum TaxID=2698649 RepID=A0ABX2F6C2_9PSEU|nr:hypothetical protein [Kibdelosporangium persicum]NRN66908.1 FAD-dependent pyridine nucleotide-disulfide oxidoreductase [Kibdelosporangium persicum]
MTVREEDVQRLLDAEVDNAVMVLLEGRVQVVAAADLDSPQYRGALRVASREDIAKRHGPLGEHELKEVAAQLDMEIAELGG